MFEDYEAFMEVVDLIERSTWVGYENRPYEGKKLHRIYTEEGGSSVLIEIEPGEDGHPQEMVLISQDRVFVLPALTRIEPPKIGQA